MKPDKTNCLLNLVNFSLQVLSTLPVLPDFTTLFFQHKLALCKTSDHFSQFHFWGKRTHERKEVVALTTGAETFRRLRSNVSQSLGWSNRRLPSHLRISKCCFSYTIISITMVGSVNSIFSNTGTLQSGSTLIEVPLSNYGKSVHSYQIKPVAVPSTNAESKCHFLLMRPPPGGGLRSSAVSQAPSLSNYSKKRP